MTMAHPTVAVRVGMSLALAAVVAACQVEDSESTEEFVWKAYLEHVDVPEEQVDWVTPDEMLQTAEDTCELLAEPDTASVYDEDTIVLARVLVETLCPSKLGLLR